MIVDASLLEEFGQIAEIAATMAGFAAVAGVIDRTRDESASRVQGSSFGSLLATTVTCLVLALLPIWLNRVFEEEQIIWRISFGAFLLMQVLSFSIYLVVGEFRSPPLIEPRLIRSLVITTTLALLAGGVSLTVVGAICVLGYLETHWATLYHAILLFFIVNAGISFIYLLTAKSFTRS